MNIFARAVVFFLLALTFAVLSVQNEAQAQSCSNASIQRALGKQVKLTPSDRSKLLQWCRRSEGKERAAGQTAQRSSGSTAQVGGSGSLASASGGGTEIICTANNCVCWQGNHWNGCNDISICATELKCTWHLCTCTPN